MRLSGRSFWAVIAIVLLVGTMAPLAVLRAQSTTTTLTLAVPSFSRVTIDDKLLGEFEASRPGVKVSIINSDATIPLAASGIDKHLEEVQKYASSADVVYVDSYRLTVEGTRAGYFLDLAPLVNEDKTLNVDDFYPAVWQAFQWDQGVWALPTAADPLILMYQPSAFDKLGLAYPNEKWTLSDLDNAIRKLAVKDADGKVTQAGIDVFTGYSDIVLFRSLLGEGLFDTSTIPNTPRLTKPGVEALLDAWFKIDQDGLIGHDFNKAPISIGSAFYLVLQFNADEKRVGVLLPGGKAGLDTQGFAVSVGTQHPELAYALASFLTTKAQIGAGLNLTPARKSLADVQPDNPSLAINIPAEVKKLAEQAVNNGFSASEMRYADYLAVAFQKMKDGKLDAKSALEAAEAQAIKDQQVAADKKGKYTLVVATAIPPLDQKGGKMTLKFGLISLINPLPQQDKWDKLTADFAASDPQVGRVELDTSITDVNKISDQNDCFYLPFNDVPNLSPSLLLNLDPFLSADNSFDKADVLGDTMTQLQRDNKTWAYPIAIEPAVLMYDSDRFSKAGLPAPANGWTIDAFKNAVKTFKLDPKDPPPFEAQGTGGLHLLMLMAAYGGLPLDFRTDPPTVNFTDPATVDAIRQVLDLAKQGYLKYDAVGNLIGGGLFSSGQTAPIYTDTLSLYSFRRAMSTSQSDPYKPTLYPKGSQYAAASFNISTAYISAKSRNPEACYRWISTLAKHPELFSALPARRSLLGALAQTQGPDVVALYAETDKMLQDPNTIAFPSQFASGTNLSGFLIQHWLYQAFDKYVLQDQDLGSALKDAEGISKGFQACAVNLPPLDTSDPQKAKDYIKQFGDCAVKVDPSLKLLFDLMPK